MKFISVIVPCYNEGKYITECIESIISQDYPKKNLEVFFIDGLSTDNTRRIISEYSVEYSFIKLLDNPAKIVPKALNIGIMASVGEIIIRLDAHSFYPKNYFRSLAYYLFSLKAES